MLQGGPAWIVICYTKIQFFKKWVSLKSECIKGYYDEEINKIQNMKNSMRKGTQVSSIITRKEQREEEVRTIG